MGGVRHLRPLRVAETASRMLETGLLRREPPWYRTVAAIPPSTSLVRELPVQLHEKKLRKHARKIPGLFKPQKIVYPEDELRNQFFRDHPWELARPRIVVENDGKDYRRVDWSKGIVQKGKKVDGESVVQRQYWLMTHADKSQSEAYDIARKEFYDYRMQEDIERRVAAEEARAVGATFHKSYVELGVELEQQYIERWAEEAKRVIRARKTMLAQSFSDAAEEEPTSPALADELDSPLVAAAGA